MISLLLVVLLVGSVVSCIVVIALMVIASRFADVEAEIEALHDQILIVDSPSAPESSMTVRATSTSRVKTQELNAPST